MLKGVSSAWFCSAPREIDSFVVGESDDDEIPVKEKKVEEYDISSSSSSSNLSSSSFNSASDSDDEDDSEKYKTDKKKEKEMDELLQVINPEPIGETLQNDLNYLASTHYISTKKIKEQQKKTQLNISQAKYTYFDTNTPDQGTVELSDEESQMKTDLITQTISSIQPKTTELLTSTTENPETCKTVDASNDIFAYKYTNYHKIRKISASVLDRLNNTINGHPPGYVDSRKIEEEKPAVPVRKHKKFNKKFEPQIERPKREPKIETREPLVYKPNKSKGYYPSFVSREPKKVERKKSPEVKVQPQELSTTQKKTLEMFQSDNTIPHFEKTSIPNHAPQSLKKTHPEIYTKKGKEKAEKERLVKLAKDAELQDQREAEMNKPIIKPSEEEVINELEKILDNEKIQEWEEEHPRKAPVQNSSDSCDESSDFAFGDSQLTDDEIEATGEVLKRPLYIDPHETEASKLRNQAIRQKMALINAQKRMEEEDKFERDVNNRIVAAKIAPTLKKMETAVTLQVPDINERIKKAQEDEKARAEAIERGIQAAKNTEFIAKRQERKIMAISNKNSMKKREIEETNRIPERVERRRKKNQQLQKLWDPNPASHFQDDED